MSHYPKNHHIPVRSTLHGGGSDSRVCLSELAQVRLIRPPSNEVIQKRKVESFGDTRGVKFILLLSCPLHNGLTLAAHAFARSVTVARSSAAHASSSRRQERKWAIVCGSRSSNPPNGRRRDSPISPSLFSHGPPL